MIVNCYWLIQIMTYIAMSRNLEFSAQFGDEHPSNSYIDVNRSVLGFWLIAELDLTKMQFFLVSGCYNITM